MGYDEETKTSFEQCLADHIATPGPRHFGNSIAGRFTGLKKSDQDGIFAARILIQGPEGKFWINGLITKMEIKSKSMYLVYYDQCGQQFIDIDLEHLAEMQVYKPRDGTYFVIENEVLVLKQETINHHSEGGNRGLTFLTPPKSEPKETTQVSFRLR